MFNALLKKLTSKTDSKDVAKKRLKFALIYDKLEVKDEMLVDLQKDIVDVISRYFEIDSNGLQLDIHRAEDCSALVFNTPILSARHSNRHASAA